MKRFKLSDVAIKIRKRKAGATRNSALSPVYKEILSLEIGDVLVVDTPEGKTLEDTRTVWTQRLVTKLRPALMNRQKVKARYELDRDYEAVIVELEDGEAVAIQCVENTCTEELYEKYKARSQKQQASKAAKKAAKAPVQDTQSSAPVAKSKVVDDAKAKPKKKPVPKADDDLDEIEL
jgi:hypothetical protein